MERSTETAGMERAVGDFDLQLGLDPEVDTCLLEWIHGDGASYANLVRLTKLCAQMEKKFTNKITTPEIWHTGVTDLNSIATNHYGPAASSDPSSLSTPPNAAGFKCPSNLAETDKLPTLEVHGALLVDRYTSQAAVEHSLDASEAANPSYANRIPEGSPWGAPRRAITVPEPPAADSDPRLDLVDIQEPSATLKKAEETDEPPEHHEERQEFTGDRALRNSEIFLMEFGWWIEMIMAVPEGNIGRVWEIFKIWIFEFVGSSHQNYMAYLLEVYCFLRYEASKDLKGACAFHLTRERSAWMFPMSTSSLNHSADWAFGGCDVDPSMTPSGYFAPHIVLRKCLHTGFTAFSGLIAEALTSASCRLAVAMLRLWLATRIARASSPLCH
ncbi:hypothetical protein B0H13DRAFT_1921278 [Mycena leptocephala]|nr:hypothetical protein B0H13DRAFT_1921278 [Mycena leptocephala]